MVKHDVSFPENVCACERACVCVHMHVRARVCVGVNVCTCVQVYAHAHVEARGQPCCPSLGTITFFRTEFLTDLKVTEQTQLPGQQASDLVPSSGVTS